MCTYNSRRRTDLRFVFSLFLFPPFSTPQFSYSSLRSTKGSLPRYAHQLYVHDPAVWTAVWGSQSSSVSLDRWMKASVGLVLCTSRPWIMDFGWAPQVYVIPFNSHNTERSRLVLFWDEYAANVEWQMQCSSSIGLRY